LFDKENLGFLPLGLHSKNHVLVVGFEVSTAVVMKSSIFWEMTTRRHIPEDETLHALVFQITYFLAPLTEESPSLSRSRNSSAIMKPEGSM
jgi:hypothetical protein